MQLSRHVAPSALFLLLLLIASATSMPAQQPSQQPGQQTQQSAADGSDTYTLSVNSRLVVLDVAVTDKKGDPVNNLRKEDFEILEDKQPQTIYSFEAPALHTLPPGVVIHSTEELDRVAPNASVNIIVLDEYSERFEDFTYARTTIGMYLKSQPQQLAQPTMLLEFNVNGRIVLQDYTQDRDALLSSLDNYKPDILTITSSGTNSWGHQELTMGLRSLAQIAETTKDHPGHKTVIWVGHGLPHGLKKLPPELLKDISLLQEAGVTLDQIDPRGVGVPVDAPFSDANFAYVAMNTGGRWFYNRNDLETEIDSSARSGSELYTLSYIPPVGNDVKEAVRTVRIVMKDRNLHATAPGSCFPNRGTAPGWEVAKGNLIAPTVNMDGAITGALADMKVYDGIPLMLARTDTPGEIAVQIGSKALPWIDHSPDQLRTTRIRISCGAFDKQGKMLDHEGVYTEATSSAPETPQENDVEFSVDCATNPAAVRLRVVVQATDSGKIGAANLDLEAK